MKLHKLWALAPLSLLLSACGSGNYDDLDAYMAQVKEKPAGIIKPIPPFKAYTSFTYGATGKRSPFEKPIEVREIARLQVSTAVKPDDNRTREYLEQFSIDSLDMVGTLEQGGVLWALMQDQNGGVHRVTEGNYIGKNHGKIIQATDSYLSVIEIVPNGVDGWVQRPRTIKLKSVQ